MQRSGRFGSPGFATEDPLKKGIDDSFARHDKHREAAKEEAKAVVWYVTTWFIVVCCIVGLAIIASIVGSVISCVTISRAARAGGGTDLESMRESGEEKEKKEKDKENSD